MFIEENWAIFVEGNKVNWSFGNPDQEFLTIVVNFLVGLSQFGEELFSDGVANINFNVKKRSGLKASELIVVSLARKFFFVISDPLITLKLINIKGGIPSEIEEIMRAVLVGQGAILYAKTLTNAESKEEKVVIENVFQAIILDINKKYEDKIDMIVSGSSCNFSMLEFQDILLFHYYLRREQRVLKQHSKWALISDVSGGALPFTYQVVEKDPVVLSGYLAIFISFIQALFDAKPRSMVFGGLEISYLKFVHSKDYFIAIGGSFNDLCKTMNFYSDLNKIDKDIFDALTPDLKNLIIEEITSHFGQILISKELDDLLNEQRRLDIITS